MLSLAQKLTIVAALVAFVEARFGQEQIPVAAVQALQAGAPGEAATLAGQIPSSLLAAASPCDKLSLADKIAALGNGADVLAAAKGLVAAETNFNPFAVDKPFVCADPALPATAALRGIIPLVDPAVAGSAAENAASAQSLNTPFNADGLSQAEVMIAQGFSTFQAVDGSGAKVQLAGQDGAAAGGGGAAGGNAGNGNANAGNGNANAGNGTDNANAGNGNANAGNGNAGNNNAGGCGAGAGNGNANAGKGKGKGNGNGNANAGNGNGNANAGNGNANAGNGDANAGGNNNNNAGGNNNNNNAGGNAGAANGAVDFGECTPTMDFKGGRNGRPATEFTFLPTDPLVAQGQQEALNPNIITNRICDQLTNVCNANDAAKQLCQTTKAQIQALGTRDQSTADTWNAALGF